MTRDKLAYYVALAFYVVTLLSVGGMLAASIWHAL
jgi:hypothetical protein